MLALLYEIFCLLLQIAYECLASFVAIFVRNRKDVAGQIVLITGAGSGIGRLLSLRFGKLGAIVVCSDVNEENNEETVKMVKSEGGKAHGYIFDVSDKDEVYKVAEIIEKEVGVVDILINNAGIVSGNNFLDIPDKLAEKTFEVNAVAHFWTTKAFGKPMFERNSGHLVYVASVAGLCGVAGLSDYCASKFAVVGFVESLASEIYIKGSNVKTTAICPYYINTGMFDGISVRFPNINKALEPDYAADRMVDAIRCEDLMLIMPRIMHVGMAIKAILPVRANLALGKFLGFLTSMDTFTGRVANKKSQ